jgi:hypothetical protein
VTRTRLLLGWSDDPDIVAELARDAFEKLEAAGVDAVVIGQENAHPAAMSEAQRRRNRRKNAPISQQLGDFFTVILSVLVKARHAIYSAELGMTD